MAQSSIAPALVQHWQNTLSNIESLVFKNPFLLGLGFQKNRHQFKVVKVNSSAAGGMVPGLNFNLIHRARSQDPLRYSNPEAITIDGEDRHLHPV